MPKASPIWLVPSSVNVTLTASIAVMSSVATFSWDEIEAALVHVDVRGPFAAPERAALTELRFAEAVITA